ncbi:hypothetical protein AAF712_008439 [Marasmius tenuissimus]|uniref:Uncharacterized protein n=1 Tax=Marasmius tenuissimus TaxID=585030 RepID=A0ABR2ZT92_9AGAR
MLNRLPADIQSGVCNQEIKIYDGLYDIFWDDGSWFYVYASQTLTTAQNANPNKIFTKCKATTTSSPSSTPTPTSSQPSQPETEESSGIGTGAIAGIAAGIAVLAIAGVLGAFFFLRRKKRKGYVNASGIIIDDDDDEDDSRVDTHVGALEPYPYTSTTPSQQTMTNTGSYFPASTIGYNSSQPDDTASQQHRAPGTSSSSSGQGSSTGYVVSNPDSGSSARPGKGSIDASQSPRSPPPMLPLPAKGAAPNARKTYVPPAPSEADASERHFDAGPVEGSSLQRNTSGRLPPAYGDLI